MTTVEILRAAKAVIDRPEKWRGGFHKAPKALCVIQAVMVVRHVSGTSYAHAAAIQAVCKQIKDRFIIEWNDDPATTHADVMAAFDRAIAAEEEKS